MDKPLATSVPRGALEALPKWLICVPLVLQWLWLSLRYGSATLPSAVNPAITAGGLVGETKLEYFRGMGALARGATARHCALPPARQNLAGLRIAMAQAGLVFPMVVKPDLGMCGFGVRLVGDEAALMAYLALFPLNQQLLLQEYLPQEGEAGIFYARKPGAAQGRIIGLALRYFPRVTGDGIATLAQLIAADPRTSRVQGRHDHVAVPEPDRVPARGEVVRLATIGSTRVGGLYRDGATCITPALTAAVEAIARDMPAFYAGRFDVRFEDLQHLSEGRGLKIMEVNGAGSEAIQAWDPDIGLLAAFRIIFAKQRVLFAIGAANRRRGHRPVSLFRLAQLHIMQQRLLEAYPPSN
ncbi:ATP-grasp domain-containing protein [Polaromonas eurypsychrophila]|uniref:ATP-grasp domain-containing protein n=1 Tax=Polaromonas eurypsychrophila TaxID=1614635 RepID=A0A916WGD1_9BURK|nr:hypothetical protein [Polaromonas eurypsychrophila]GGA96786.1 hypothetical protein GCM10011496_17300 [Polaromonas eurypsychrophila]